MALVTAQRRSKVRTRQGTQPGLETPDVVSYVRQMQFSKNKRGAATNADGVRISVSLAIGILPISAFVYSILDNRARDILR